ncbi:tRNA (adenosine(37)-N6)-dimethylallyltransferase MiaA [Rhodocaloribacter litoris]|uniref:tRNA (adenosine(37)-N6)-dimethylallyltransferase MiaA n=1 Tax=Rhodocaloribacter litoris TaxID=2558931 RepID=UPI0021D40D7D|nr:tRNA (adenosine(37)-N6)-dimethylallyltransferase MiaA [Rhodocaloribacter litoris]
MIAGPTATGKTWLSIELAERVGAEIVSADSRQVYRGLDIGTAKPTVEERRGIPHHFIDELELEVPFSAGRFAAAARERIRSILERGRLPVVVGGSTLYLHALIHGLPDLPEADPDLRHALNQRLAREGGEALYRELQRVDPGFAATLDPTKTQRLVRGLEVYYATGRPLSSFPTTPPEPGFRYRVVVLCRDRKELYARINARVDAMIEAGLVDEVRALAAQGYDERINALNTIGYREVFAHLRGEIPFGEMVRLIKRNTRRYAKRQMTWFRRYGFVSYNNGYDLLL